MPQAIIADEADGSMARMTPATDRTSETFTDKIDNPPTMIALADPDLSVSSMAPSSHPAPPKKAASWPTPARFFTINQVLSKRENGPSPVEFASIRPTEIMLSDRPAAQIPPTQGEEPFGLYTFRAPDGLLSVKWHRLEADIKAESPALGRCRADSAKCTPAEARFVAMIKDADGLSRRAKLQLVNDRVNAAIRYTEDSTQWHEADVWSAPLDGDHTGSYDTGRGDCEDYAIAKYVALRQAGVPESDLRVLLVKDQAVHLDHAVLAVRDDGHWVILDNRWSRLTEDNELRQFVPLFALNYEGVKLFAAPYARRSVTPLREPRLLESHTYTDAGLSYSARLSWGVSGALSLLM
jgi:predicted transglutaminase-like cysteine proteinase